MAISIDRAVGVGGVSVSLIGTGIVVLWPDKRWLGWVFIGLGMFIAVLAMVWALARWHTRQEFERKDQNLLQPLAKPAAHVEATHGGVHVNVGTISQHADQHSSIPEPQPQQNIQRVLIEPGLAQIEHTKTDRYTGEVANLYRSTSDDPDNILVDTDVAFAKFRRDDDSPVPSVKAKATIEFLNPKGESCFTVDRAYWWAKDDEHGTGAWFGAGDTQKMIIALVGSEGRVFPYSGHYVAVDRVGLGFRQEFVLEPRDSPLTAKEYLVRIEITGTKDGVRRVKQSFEYDLIVRPRPEFKLRLG
jgi:hypothetical protein